MIKKNLSVCSLLALTLLVGGCSSAVVNVLPKENHQYQVVARDTDSASAQNAAIKGARDYCKKMGQTVVFGKGSNTYVGSMPQSTRNLIHGASTAALLVSNIGMNAGMNGQNNDTLGALGIAGNNATSGLDYQTEYLFTCQ